MAEDNYTLSTFYSSWKAYQEHIKDALALRAAPGLRSIGENALHIVGCRVFWFAQFLGEDGGEAMQAYAGWNEAALAPGAPVPAATELVQGLATTWRFMADCLARWNPAEMQQTFPDDWDGEIVQLSRAWVVWHVLEHDLHHGGEMSLTAGMHGLNAHIPG